MRKRNAEEFWRRESKFNGFGKSDLCAVAVGEPSECRVDKDRLRTRQELRSSCPAEPGIYGWIDPHDHLHYVGKSKSLRHRLLSYFAKTPADPKMARIRRQSARIVWQPVGHELLALLREQELIHRFRPGFNSQGQPTRRRPAYVCLSDGPAPMALVKRQLAPDAGRKVAGQRFGPILGTRQLKEAIEVLNNCFGLRDCPEPTPMEFNDQLQLFPSRHSAKCIRLELATCPGPCAAACSRQDYQQGVERALAFLRGQDVSVLDQLKDNMQRAALHQQFESASVWRDRWERLGWLHRRLDPLRRARTGAQLRL